MGVCRFQRHDERYNILIYKTAGRIVDELTQAFLACKHVISETPMKAKLREASFKVLTCCAELMRKLLDAAEVEGEFGETVRWLEIPPPCHDAWNPDVGCGEEGENCSNRKAREMRMRRTSVSHSDQIGSLLNLTFLAHRINERKGHCFRVSGRLLHLVSCCKHNTALDWSNNELGESVRLMARRMKQKRSGFEANVYPGPPP
jgi:hypothetical protein